MFTKKVTGATRVPCTAEEVDCYKYAFSRPNGVSGPLNYYRMAFRYEPFTERNRTITVPTLRIWGEQDNALEKKLAEFSADYCEDHTINYIATAGHWVMLDEPQLVNSYMEKFLSRKQSE